MAVCLASCALCSAWILFLLVSVALFMIAIYKWVQPAEGVYPAARRLVGRWALAGGALVAK
jgi:hypothetical protein